jgi:hypothetical protein
VWYKRNFVNSENFVHTQNVESFNNYLKHEIKKRKGVRTCDQEEFLVEMVWFWNNKQKIFENLIELIKKYFFFFNFGRRNFVLIYLRRFFY